MQKNKLALAIGIVVFLVVIIFAAGLISIPMPIKVAYWKAAYKINSPVGDQAAFKAVHQATRVKNNDPNGPAYSYDYTKADRGIISSESARCMACHGSMTDLDEKGNPKYLIHRKMLIAPMLNFSCTDCHKQVDIRKRSPSRVTIRVDRKLCSACHNPKKTALPADWTNGKTWGTANAPSMPPLMDAHGTDEKSGRQWIQNHSRVGMAVGIDQCRQCHIPNSELDFCRVCHLRGGFMPSSHRAVVEVPINQIYPESGRTDTVKVRWKGFHFVVVRDALAKLGVKVDSSRNLPMDQIQKLPCGACHVLKDWCTRCHIKHNPNWLDPNVGHPAYVAKYGSKYCFRCHDISGSKCVSCHEFVGQLN